MVAVQLEASVAGRWAMSIVRQAKTLWHVNADRLQCPAGRPIFQLRNMKAPITYSLVQVSILYCMTDNDNL